MPCELDVAVKQLFGYIGVWVCRHRLVCLFWPALLSTVSLLGCVQLKIYENMREGYTPLDAPSRTEMKIWREFHSRDGVPYIFGLLCTSRDGGSMLRLESLNAVVHLQDTVLNHINITQQTHSYTYNQLCSHYCELNKPVQMVQETLYPPAKTVNLLTLNMTFPLATWVGGKVNLALNFYGVQGKKGLESAEMIALWFRADVPNEEVAATLKDWELEVFSLLQRHSQHYGQLIVAPIGDNIINHEVMRGGLSTLPLFLLGFLLLTIFVGSTVIAGARTYSWRVLVVVVASILSPIMASGTVLGLLLLVHGHINVMMFVIPVLVLAVGVDDAFLMLHCWRQAVSLQHTPHERMRFVFREIGPSITITSVTNCLAFGIGAIVPTPELRLFCIAASLSMVCDWLYQISFFAVVLSIADAPDHYEVCHHNHEHKPAGNEPNGAADSHKSVLISQLDGWMCEYSNWLLHWSARLVGVCLWLLYLATAIAGTVLMQPDMNPELLVPKDSLISDAMLMHRKYLWAEYNPSLLIVSNCASLTNVTHYDRLLSFIDQLESQDKCIGRDGTLLWLRDYEQYASAQQSMTDLMSFFDYEQEGDHLTLKSFDLLPDFLDERQYQHWRSSVHYHESSDGRIIVDEFTFGIGHRSLASLGEQALVLNTLRTSAKHAPQPFKVSVWQLNAMFSDVILNIRLVTLRTLAITFCSMALVCALFIPDLSGLIAASLSVASICTGVLGYLHWWGASLDPITMAFALMAVGFSVDFTAHVSYHYYNEYNGHNQLQAIQATFRVVAWPMLQAGTSTVLCMAPQVLSPLGAYSVLVKTIVLVVLLGFVHGLFLLPLILTVLPTCSKRTRHNPDESTKVLKHELKSLT